MQKMNGLVKEKKMDAKITKVRLGRMLSYDWIKIVGIAAAAIVVWMLIFTMTATRITPAQQFTVVNYNGNAGLTYTKLNEVCNNAFREGVFSYEVLELSNPIDLPSAGENAATLLEARTSTHEGDVVFVSQQPDSDTKTTAEDGTVSYARTYLESFVYKYGYSLFDFDRESEKGYFAQLENYLNGYYEGGWENGTLNEAKVKADFRARVAKDKRYKKEKQLLQGEADDIQRIKDYRTALEKMYWYLDNGVVSLTKTTLENYYAEGQHLEGYYSINLCPNEKMDKLREAVYYSTTVTDPATGKDKPTEAVLNMNVCFFDFAKVTEGFEHESLLFTVYLIDTYSTEKHPSVVAATANA